VRKRFFAWAGLLVLGFLVTACLFDSFDERDQFTSVDKSVDQATTARVTSFLVDHVPAVRSRKAELASSGKKVKLTLSIQSAPEPDHTRNDPDYRFHAEYYWIYTNYTAPDGLLAYETYLVHKDLKDIYVADSQTDRFVRVYP
jgi:hypothetical protein